MGANSKTANSFFEYTVCLLQGNQCVTPPQGAANITSGTVTNTAGGAIPISVVFNQGGMSSENWTRTYRVTVTERKGEKLGINYNPSGKTVSIDFAITDNQKGALQYKVLQVESSSKEDTSQDQKITFSNYVYASNLPSTGLNTYAGLVIAVIVAGALFTAVALWPNRRRHERE
ncbi:Spy0128 family protein [Bifidobacterium animalis]|uniref:Spy0128 family protein n=1 Tax=Bifidobacterium animalis TaxID=28025 RepID=UPI0009BAD874|nr:FctA domain-containing protein [Bifidobacterium animalis]